MKPDPHLEAHLKCCRETAEQLREDGMWPWPDEASNEPDQQLSQDTIDAVADLIAILQSIEPTTNDGPNPFHHHDNNQPSQNEQNNQRSDEG